MDLSQEFHVGFSVRVLDESVGLVGHVTDQENRGLIAICSPLGPSQVVEGRAGERFLGWDGVLEVDKGH